MDSLSIHLLLRSSLAGNPTFDSLLQRLRDVALGAYAHQELPFEKLVESLRPERSLNHLAFTRIMFALQTSGAKKWHALSAGAEGRNGWKSILQRPNST